MFLSGYRCMWVVAMFDLPVDTPKARRAYTQFVKFLRRDGFTRLQYSVYGRHSASKENAAVHIARIKATFPRTGRCASWPLPTSSLSGWRYFGENTGKRSRNRRASSSFSNAACPQTLALARFRRE